jgi:hypothetical protein
VGRAEQLNDAFADLAETLVGEFDLAETLDRVLGYCVDACGAAGVGIVIEDGHGVLRDIAYSDERVRRLERLQVQTGEGPCAECVRLGRAVVEPDLVAARVRWPQFAVTATESGFLSVRALPMRYFGRTLGALNLFDADRTRCADGELQTIQAFADLAMLAIVQHTGADDAAAIHVTRALAGRTAIERARGMIAEDGAMTVEQALDQLRAYAARTGQGVTRVAEALVEGEALTADVLHARREGTR